MDPIIQWINTHGPFTQIIQGYFPDYVADGNVRCPKHIDRNASLHINPMGKAFCHAGCGFQSRDIVDLVRQLAGVEYDEARDIIYRELAGPIPEEEVAAYERNLWDNIDALHYLHRKRNLPDTTIRKARLGLEPKTKRIVIPIFDMFGYVVNFRRRGWLPSHEQKALNVRGRGEVRLYPAHLLYMERRVLLVEGEWDALVGRAFGLPAITWTGGASSWNDEEAKLLEGKAVWILYDNDPAGRIGQMIAYDKLTKMGCPLVVSMAPVLSVGKDLTDWSIRNPAAVSLLAIRIESAIIDWPDRKPLKNVCPTCGREML